MLGDNLQCPTFGENQAVKAGESLASTTESSRILRKRRDKKTSFVTPVSIVTSSIKRKQRTPNKIVQKSKRRRIEFGQQFEKTCAREIRGISGALVSVLNNAHVLHEFMELIRGLCSGSLPPDNIAFLLCLERAKLSTLSTTTQMKYSDKTTRFWKVVYRILKGKAIRLFSGPKHRGRLTNNTTRRGQFHPAVGQCNFAVPSKVWLTNGDGTSFPNVIQPGINSDVVKLAATKQDKDFVLAIDGKKIAQGLSVDGGDIDLWGHESPKVADNKERIETEEKSWTEIMTYVQIGENMPMESRVENLPDKMKHELHEKLKKAAGITSQRTKDLREMYLSQNFLKEKLTKLRTDNPASKEKYAFALSNVHGVLYQIKACIERMLNVTAKICNIGSHIGPVDLSMQENLILLKEPTDLPEECHQPEYTKQRSPEWFELGKKAPVTGSTFHRALGLDSLKEQKKHIMEVKQIMTPEPFPQEVLERLEHGTENEKHTLATLAATVVPFLYPQLYVFEDGCSFIPGRENGQHLVEVSSDGSLRSMSDTDRAEAVIEIKCPWSQSYKLPVFYTLPQRYVCQMLAEMAAAKCSKGVFVSFSVESTTVCEVAFDNELWRKLLAECVRIYGASDVPLPKRTSEAVPIFKKDIEEFVRNNVRFCLEVPSSHAVDTNHRACDDNGLPYLFPRLEESTRSVTFSTLADVQALATEAIDAQKQAHLLSRRKASEILAFILTDTDRLADPELPHHLPLAYGLKGYSLPVQVLRLMCGDVKNVCHAHGINVVCECFDGQWHNLCIRGENGEPLNRLELAKQGWKDVQGTKKQVQLTFLKGLYRNENGSYDHVQAQRMGGRLCSTSADSRMGTIVRPVKKSSWERITEKNKTCESTHQLTEDEPENTDEARNPQETMDVDESESQVAEIPFAPSKNDLDSVLWRLKAMSPNEWKTMTTERLRKLLNVKGLTKKFTKVELQVLTTAWGNHHPSIKDCAGAKLKADIVIKLAQALGASNEENSSAKTVPRKRRIGKLMTLAFQVLSSKAYPKAALNVVMAKLMYPEREVAWEAASPLPMRVYYWKTRSQDVQPSRVQ